MFSRYGYYRPQRSWVKVMFLQASVILLTGGGVSASVHAGIPPQEQTSPQEQTPPAPSPWEQTPQSRHPPGADTPQSRHSPRSRHPPGAADTPPPGVDPLGADTPLEQTPHPPQQTPLPEADSGVRSTSGRYASYCNAFLFINVSFCRTGPLKGLLINTICSKFLKIVLNFA